MPPATDGVAGALSFGAQASAQPARTPLVKVIVRRGDIFRRFTQLQIMRMDPHVEVALSGRHVGSVPPALGGDQEPKWNYSLPPQEFEPGDELQLTVLNKSVLRKDVLIGSGAVRLSPELYSGADRKNVEQTVKLFKKHEGEKPEHTGNVQVCLNFLILGMRDRADSKASGADLGLLAGTTSVSSMPSIPSVGSRSQLPRNDVSIQQSISERSVVPCPTMMSHTSSCGAQLQQLAAASSLHSLDHGLSREDMARGRRSANVVVAHQYWERDIRPRRQEPVLCTDAVRLWLQKWRLSPLRCAVCACLGGAGGACWAGSAAHLL